MRALLILFGGAWVTLVLGTTAATMQPIELAAMASRSDDGNPREGRRVFLRENCYGCHGGRAGGGMCPSLREDRPDEDDVREVVRNGTPNGMPPFPELTEQDIQNLAAYFDTLRSDEEPVWSQTDEALVIEAPQTIPNDIAVVFAITPAQP